MSRDQALAVAIEGDRLVISIGIDALMETVEGGDDWDEDNEIIDPDAFAAEIAEQLENVDQGDGTTDLHLAVDRAAYQAIENGSDAVRLASDRDDEEE